MKQFAASLALSCDRQHLTTDLLAWYRHTHRDLPWRKTDVAYHIWVSEIMLQQTQVVTVIPYYERFLARFPTVESLAAADLDEVLALWQGLGYYARARNLHAAARRVVEQYGGALPRDRRSLLALPGIGRYVAGALLSIAFGHDEVAVDANIARVLSRLFDYAGDPRSSAGLTILESCARELLPAGQAGAFNVAVMELGALVCLPRVPRCKDCPIEPCCTARQRGVERERPLPRNRVEPPHREQVAAYCTREGRLLLVRRVPRGLLGGLWELPGGDVAGGESHAEALGRTLRAALGLEIAVGAMRAQVDHAYSHLRVTVSAHAVEVAGSGSQVAHIAEESATYGGPWDAAAWVAPDDLPRYGLTGVTAKIVERLKDDG